MGNASANDERVLDELLASTRGLILESFPQLYVLSSLRKRVRALTSQSRNVAIVIDVRSEEATRALSKDYSAFIDGAFLATPFRLGNIFLATLDQFLNELADKDNSRWFDQLALLLIPEGEQLFCRAYAWEMLAFALKDRCALALGMVAPQTVVMMESRFDCEPAVRDILPIFSDEHGTERLAWRTHSPPVTRCEELWWNIWSTEDSLDYMDGLVKPHSSQFSGIGPPLAQFAGRWGIAADDNWLQFKSDSGELDHLEHLQGDVRHLMLSATQENRWANLLAASERIGALTLYDEVGNPWRTLHAVSATNGKQLICNIVSRSTMLQSYQIANAAYFSAAPLLPISPLMSRDIAFDTTIQLIRRLRVSRGLPLQFVEDALSATRTGPHRPAGSEVDTFSALQTLVTEYLNESVAEQLRCEMSHDWDVNSKSFRSTPYVSLAPYTLSNVGIEWLDEFEVCNEGGTTFDRIRRDHLHQRYWARKQVLLNGKKYSVDEIDETAKRVHITQDDTGEQPDYRIARKIRFVGDDSKRLLTSDQFSSELPGGVHVSGIGFQLPIVIETSRVLRSPDHWTNPPIIDVLPAAIERTFLRGRAVRVRLTEDGTNLLSAPAAIALAAWLNESAVTLMPEVAGFMIAVPCVKHTDRPKCHIAAAAIPAFFEDQKFDEGDVGDIWIVEDSTSDVGIVRCVCERWAYIMDLCFDWLNWFLDEAPASGIENGVCLENKVRPPRDWFAYGMDARDAAIGLVELRGALRKLTPVFRATSRRRRIGGGQLLLLAGTAGTQQGHCDVCGDAISPGKFHMLRDGRKSCNDCASIGVMDNSTLEKLYREVAEPFFRNVLGVMDVKNVKVELVSQIEICEEQGRVFIPTSGFDMRAIGLAVSNGRRARTGTSQEGARHSVLIESGFSPENTALSLVHELTHVWQFNHLDFERLRRDHGNHLIEGHAVWVEDAFIRDLDAKPNPIFDPARVQETSRDVERTKLRTDEYGVGYQLLVAKLGVFRPSAFDWMKRAYGKP